MSGEYLPDEVLAQAAKAPTTFPAWVLRELLAELVARRAQEKAAGAAERTRIVSYLRQFTSQPVVLRIADAIAARDEDDPVRSRTADAANLDAPARSPQPAERGADVGSDVDGTPR